MACKPVSKLYFEQKCPFYYYHIFYTFLGFYLFDTQNCLNYLEAEMTSKSKGFSPIYLTALYYVEVQQIGGKSLHLPFVSKQFEQSSYVGIKVFLCVGICSAQYKTNIFTGQMLVTQGHKGYVLRFGRVTRGFGLWN